VRPEHFGQLLNVHLEAIQSGDLLSGEGGRSLTSYLVESWPVFALAALGTWQAVRARKWTALYLAGWIALGIALLAVTRPTWYHHQLLVTVPAALLAAIAIGSAVQELRLGPQQPPSPLRLGAGPLSLALFLVFLVMRVPGTADGLALRLPNLIGPGKGEAEERSLLAAIHDHAAETHWLYTDRPIFAFLSGIPVPPNLAVMSAKRLRTKDLTEEEILATLEAYSPEMILNSRFGLPAVDEYRRTRNFTRIDQTLKYRLYFRQPSP
jgi:uncharacterized membrane protein YhaH (DUF805 family)